MPAGSLHSWVRVSTGSGSATKIAKLLLKNLNGKRGLTDKKGLLFSDCNE
jgi:hypothetical protein